LPFEISANSNGSMHLESKIILAQVSEKKILT